MRTNRYLACLFAVALGAWGCDSDPETDAGTPGVDSGPGGTDAGTDGGTPPDEDGGGMSDAGSDAGGGTDAGPEMNFEIRLVNNIPGLTGSTEVPGGFHVCTYFANNMTGAVVAGTGVFRTQTVGPVPFRGVSPYLAFTSIAPFNYLVGIYDPPSLGDPAACPADPNAAGAPVAALIATVEPDAVPVDSRVTAIATGLVPDTIGATGGALPSVCFNAGTGMFNGPCATATETQLVTVIDDQTEPAAGMTRFRVSNMAANSTPPSGFTVCYDPGLVPNPSGDGSCIDASPMMTDETELAAGVPYGTVTDYSDRSPVVPTGVPMAGVGGGIFLAVEMGTGCPDFSASGSNRCYPILAAWPTPMAADEIVPSVAPDTINTIFISGLIGQGPPNNTAFFVWQDDYVAP